MINSLNIKNYRNLNDLNIKSLGRINLITGKNNTGKSTLLEAIMLLVSKGEMRLILQILLERGEHFRFDESLKSTESSVKTLSSMFNDRKISFNEEDKISISSDLIFELDEASENDNLITLNFIRYIDEEDDDTVRRRIITEIDDENTNIKIGFQVKSKKQVRIYPLNDGIDRFVNRVGFKSNDYSDLIKYVKTKNIEKDTNSKLWDSIVLTNKEKFVIQGLKIIEDKTDGITFKEVYRNERMPFIKLSDSGLVLPLQSMGDGINRILTMILALVNSENGYFLVDEFENGLHFSVQEKLWQIIFDLSERLNIQVFITTHSEDTIRAFETIINNQDNKLEGKLIRLENKNGIIKEIIFDADELNIATTNNIEIR